MLYIIYNMILKSISIKEEHEDWIKTNSINLSRFIQNKIDVEIKKCLSKI